MKQSSRLKLIIGMTANLVACLTQLLINFFLSPYILKQLGEASYGFITLATNFTEYIALITVSINSMAGRFISIEYNQGNKRGANEYFSSVFWFNFVVSAMIFLATILFLTRIDSIINVDAALIDDVRITFMFTFVNTIVSFISTCYIAVLLAIDRMDINAYIQILSKFVGLLVIIVLFSYFMPRIFYFSFANLISTIVVLVLLCTVKKRFTPELNIKLDNFSIHRLSVLAKSGFWFLLSNISSLLLTGMDLLMANLILDQGAMGRLAVAKQLPIAVGSLLGYFSNVYTASFTRLVACGKKNELVEEVKYTLRTLGVFLTTPFAGIIVFGVEFFRLWLPQSIYTESDINQIYILTMLTMANVIVNAYMYSIHSLYIAIDKVKKYSLIIFLCSIVSIVSTLFILMSTSLGVYAIAGTSTIVLSLVNLIWVPTYAEHILQLKKFTFIFTIIKNYIALVLTILLFRAVQRITIITTWRDFILTAFVCALMGYLINFMIIMNSEERGKFFGLVKNRENNYENRDGV